MEGLEVGAIVRVPFGHRRVLGVVVERAETSDLPPERLAEPLEALEAGAPAGPGPLRLSIGPGDCSTPPRGPERGLSSGARAGGPRGAPPRGPGGGASPGGRAGAPGGGAGGRGGGRRSPPPARRR